MKLRDQAYQRFTHGLLAREIHAGQFVSQRELAAITGMTLGAIRELIPRLEADGLIRTVPQRGIQIAHVDVNLIRNAFGFRLIVEREAFARFAEKASDAFQAPFSSLEPLQVDYLNRSLRVKQKGGKTWNFTVKNDSADVLFVFHRDVEAARKKLADGYARAR